MKNKSFTMEEQLNHYRRKFRLTLSALILFILLAGTYLYLNLDYLAFKHFITGHYIYTETLERLYQKELKTDPNGRYFPRFDDVVISVVTRAIREINQDQYTYLYTPENLQLSKTEEKKEAAFSEVKPLTTNTGYLHLTNFSKYTAQFMDKSYKNLAGYKNLIIDLRDNYGGDIGVMSKISGMFLPKGSVIATDKMRWFQKTYRAGAGEKLNYEKVIILQNKNTASAAENMTSALRENLSNVTLIGETTFGKGIGQFTLPLKDGFAVKATVLLWYTPTGGNIQGQGIKPDFEYTGEDMLAYALRVLDW